MPLKCADSLRPKLHACGLSLPPLSLLLGFRSAHLRLGWPSLRLVQPRWSPRDATARWTAPLRPSLTLRMNQSPGCERIGWPGQSRWSAWPKRWSVTESTYHPIESHWAKRKRRFPTEESQHCVTRRGCRECGLVQVESGWLQMREKISCQHVASNQARLNHTDGTRTRLVPGERVCVQVHSS